MSTYISELLAGQGAVGDRPTQAELIDIINRALLQSSHAGEKWPLVTKAPRPLTIQTLTGKYATTAVEGGTIMNLVEVYSGKRDPMIYCFTPEEPMFIRGGGTQGKAARVEVSEPKMSEVFVNWSEVKRKLSAAVAGHHTEAVAVIAQEREQIVGWGAW